MNKSKVEKQTGLVVGRDKLPNGLFRFFLFDKNDKDKTPLYSYDSISTSVAHERLHNFHWAFVRGEILRRDNYRCTSCGIAAQGLDVHHLLERSNGGVNYDFSILVTLCRSCHQKIHFGHKGIRLGMKA